MKKLIRNLFIIATYVLMLSPGETMQKEADVEISYKLLSPQENKTEAMQIRDKMTSTFLIAYKPFQPADLNIAFATKEEWLEATFQEEFEDFLAQKTPIHWFVALKGEELLGAVFFEPDPINLTGLHARQMAVFIDEKRQGLGTQIAHALAEKFQSLYPNRKTVVANVRILNKRGLHFIKSLGFTQTESTFHGYNPKSYFGFERKIDSK